MSLEDVPLTIDVSGEGIWEHVIGDEHCVQGWCNGGRDFPAPCDCGGLIHADFGDEDEEDYWLHKKCDRCGDNYRFAEEGQP